MPTANDVMKQIWAIEKIFVKIECKKNIPSYTFVRRFPKNKKVQDWVKSRLRKYDISVITVIKGINKSAPNKMTIDALRQSYDSSAAEYIENLFEIQSVKKKYKSSKVKQSKLLETAKVEADTAKKDAESAKKQSEFIKGTVTKVSGEREELIRELTIYMKIFNNTKYICNNLDMVIKQLCDSDTELNADNIIAFLRKKLLIGATNKKIHQIMLNIADK